MEFEVRFNTISEKLKNIAAKYSGFCAYVDRDDLYAEMWFYFWSRWAKGGFEKKTESYIVQACYFHIRNYLRTVQDAVKPVSMDELFSPVDASDGADDGARRLEDIIPDGQPGIAETAEAGALYEKIMNNGLSTIEKDIVRHLYNGYTMRDIGRMFGLSHVMIVKHKKQIADKVTRNYSSLLV